MVFQGISPAVLLCTHLRNLRTTLYTALHGTSPRLKSEFGRVGGSSPGAVSEPVLESTLALASEVALALEQGSALVLEMAWRSWLLSLY
jgi:hypothetical protein